MLIRNRFSQMSVEFINVCTGFITSNGVKELIAAVIANPMMFPIHINVIVIAMYVTNFLMDNDCFSSFCESIFFIK